ncbi:MAG: hypothetical protein AB7G21_00980 [Dehalococcoidia bacterium]
MSSPPATLLSTFREAARAHGTLPPDAPLELETAFRAVRDIPWGPRTPAGEEADGSGLDPAATIEAWRGTGREKQLLLAALLQALGYHTDLLAVTHEFEAASAPWLPPPLLQEVRQAPVPDVHLLLRVQTNRMLEEWITVDATWPASAARLGLPVNDRVVHGADHRLACDPVEVYHLPEPDEDDEPGALYALIARIVRDTVGDAPEAWERRGRFMTSLATWLDLATPPDA